MRERAEVEVGQVRDGNRSGKKEQEGEITEEVEKGRGREKKGKMRACPLP
jgi:hypothetical protein